MFITIIIAIPHNLFGIDILSFFSIGSFLLFGFLLFHKWLRAYYVLITIYCSLTPLLCLQYFWARMELCPELWNAILNTSFREIKELVGKNFWILTSTVLFTSILTWQICIRLLPRKIMFTRSVLIASIGLVGILICGIVNTMVIEQGFWYYGFKKLQPLPVSWNLIYQLRQRKRVAGFDAERDAYVYKMKAQGDSVLTKTVIVLVIGETGREDHWSLGGYGRETNPLLYKEDGYFFKNVIAPAGMTILSVPLIMTATPPNDWISHYRKKGVIDAFKEAGFYTAFITNQADNLINPYSARDLHFKYVDTLDNVDNTDIAKPDLRSYDVRIIPSLVNILRKEDKRNLFVVLHTNGSHWNYAERYPTEFSVFDQSSPAVPKNQYGYDKEIAMYDNSILYTDYILKSIIDELKKINGNVAMIYTSDHGENLKDDARKLQFHSPDPTKYLLHIPYYVWMNDKMKKDHPSYDSLLMAHKDYPLLTSEMTMYTAFDLAGLETETEKEQQLSNSLLSKQLKKSEQRFYTPVRSNLRYPDLLKN